MAWWNRKKAPAKTYDPQQVRPVLQCSICTGEQVAGFQDLQTGRVEEITLIRDDAELKAFMTAYGIEKIDKVYRGTF